MIFSSIGILGEVEEAEHIFQPRLGLCESCEAQEAKYTCPRCSTKSCSLTCVKAHKVSHQCDGIRDKTSFKSLSQFTELDLLSGKSILLLHSYISVWWFSRFPDYRLLEEASRSVDAYYRDPLKRQTRQNKELPVVRLIHLFLLFMKLFWIYFIQHLHRLRCAAAQRGTQLRFLPPNFSRHKANTTYLDWKSKKIEWRIEWRFNDSIIFDNR